ncbi:MAG: hypothetical protein LBG59_06700 [Candidatus Peribacteria bacterium]|jgi:hypothetical protein|nr:hypothetical protein [Candidatus Peribacteria bacterium]
MRFPGMVIYVPVDSVDPLALFLTTNDTESTSGRSISPCETYKYSEGTETERLIIGRSYINYGSTTGKIVPTQPGICHYW